MARMTQFKRGLQDAGYDGETHDFYRAVLTVFDSFVPPYDTDEQLKRHPRDALSFCDAVRAVLELPNAPDELILGGLENGRKNRAKVMESVS